MLMLFLHGPLKYIFTEKNRRSKQRELGRKGAFYGRGQEKFKLTFERGFESFTEGNGCAQIVSKLQERELLIVSHLLKNFTSFPGALFPIFILLCRRCSTSAKCPSGQFFRKEAPSPTTENVKGSSQKLFCFQSGRRIIDMNILLV